MFDPDTEVDAAAVLLERRWFASMTAVKALQAECEALREVMESSTHAWRRARQELVRLESLRDALGDQMTDRDHRVPELLSAPIVRMVSSAA